MANRGSIPIRQSNEGINSKDMIVEVTSHGCHVCTSHALNKDGYFRKYVDGRMVMFHRYVWELVNNKIPEGYEVDHICKNRACFNVLHLQVLPASAHRTKDNKGRNGKRQSKARKYWLKKGCTGKKLSSKYGVSFGTAYKWIRKWKKQTH